VFSEFRITSGREKKLDRWGKNRPHDIVIGRDRMTPVKKTSEPWHMPRRAEGTGTDHRAGVARGAPLPIQSPGMPRRAEGTGTDHRAGVARGAPLPIQSPGSHAHRGDFFWMGTGNSALEGIELWSPDRGLKPHRPASWAEARFPSPVVEGGGQRVPNVNFELF
jgi:hypothetical protein